MRQTVTVRQLTIGEGMPKICVPIVGTMREEILEQAKAVTETAADIAEWRVDFFEHAFDVTSVIEMAKEVREMIQEMPLLVTFRTLREGGEKAIEGAQYIALNKEIAANEAADLIDVELFTGEEEVRDVIQIAHQNGVKVVVSSHEFHHTPSKEEMIKRLVTMQQLGADIPKLAVMPKNAGDVLALLQATYEMNEQYADRPIITMSMAGTGVISRVAGEAFGSAVTFGAAAKASAPGQMGVNELQKVLSLLHETMH